MTDYLDAWTRELYEQHLLQFQTAHLPEGIHPITVSAERSFGPRECIINNQEKDRIR